jgi:hypothetical protein
MIVIGSIVPEATNIPWCRQRVSITCFINQYPDAHDYESIVGAIQKQCYSFSTASTSGLRQRSTYECRSHAYTILCTNLVYALGGGIHPRSLFRVECNEPCMWRISEINSTDEETCSTWLDCLEDFLLGV